MTRPKCIDLFAGEGGSAYGYALAGFDVTAVDDQDRPGRAPSPDQQLHPGAGVITWVTADAVEYPLDGFDLATGSPPCTDHTTLRNVAEAKRAGTKDAGTHWMLEHTIDRFRASSLPFVVENVDGARRLMDGALKLCGSMFDLTDGGWLLRRHRLFVSNVMLWAPGPDACHGRRIMGVYGELMQKDRRCAGKRLSRPNGDIRAGVDRARRLMGMPWASATGLPLAIPPAYTRWIGEQLLAEIEAVAS